MRISPVAATATVTTPMKNPAIDIPLEMLASFLACGGSETAVAHAATVQTCIKIPGHFADHII